MTRTLAQSSRVRLTPSQSAGLVLSYVKRCLLEQLRSVWLIIAYLVLFQVTVLRIAVVDAAVIGAGLALVVVGLAVFMEGLLLGLMPLGEMIGVKLPQRTGLVPIMLFSCILGIGATFAEPAIGVLRAAGDAVKAWDAPLLYFLLKCHPQYLVWAVAGGVGVAVVAGMVRFLYGWSLKPFIYAGVGVAMALSAVGFIDPNIQLLTGVAWDCGAITTGPVTVPLVLALGIGICRVAGRAGSGTAGFGVVTLASILPVAAVLLLGLSFRSAVPAPMSEQEFFAAANRQSIVPMFGDSDGILAYALRNAGPQGRSAAAGGEDSLQIKLSRAAAEPDYRVRLFGPEPGAMEQWELSHGRAAARGADTPLSLASSFGRNAAAAVRAILPLVAFLLLVLVLLRERMHRGDEMTLGVAFALAGMWLFGAGIELGLARLGTQSGANLPAAFKTITLESERTAIARFDTTQVQYALDDAGERHAFFYVKRTNGMEPVAYDRAGLDTQSGRYTWAPQRGPLFGALAGVLVVLLFAFLMGYGATLAEPALNALGIKVEELSVGTFRRGLLIQAVAAGVGLGMTFGVAKVLWDIPLLYLLVPPYVIALVLTALSTEEYTNIGWDSAGVTTGPITVPLVLASGVGGGGADGCRGGFWYSRAGLGVAHSGGADSRSGRALARESS